MKKTTSIHIKGLNFIIEEDAYETLKNYMNRLERKLSNTEGKEEIIEDIELRIAELFTTDLEGSKEVVDHDMVENAITKLGEPEQYIDEDGETESTSSDDNESDNTVNENRGEYAGSEKKLYRDMDKATIAGVCSGLSAYFNIDLIIVRIIFLVLLFGGGFGFPLYIILWIVLPTANSHIDRLRMRGAPITVDSVREEVEMAAERLTKKSRSFEKQLRNDTIFTRGVNSIGRVISKIVGFFMLIFGLAFSIFFVTVVLLKKGITPVSDENGMLTPYELLNLVLEPSQLNLVWWVGGFLSLIFLVYLVATAMRFILGLQYPWYKYLSRFAMVAIIFTVIFGFYIGVSVAKEFSVDGEKRTEMANTTESFELVYETMNERRYKDKNIRTHGVEEFYLKNDRIYHEGYPVWLKTSKDSAFHVYNVRFADGGSHKDAISRAQNIRFNGKYEGDKVTVPNYYSYPIKDKLRGQEIDLVIEIPEGDSILFDEEYFLPEEDSYRLYVPNSRQHWRYNDWN